MKWAFPSLNLDTSIVANRKVSQNQNRMANSVNPDETAHEPSHQDLHCLHMYLVWSAGLKGRSPYLGCFGACYETTAYNLSVSILLQITGLKDNRNNYRQTSNYWK